MRIISGRYKKKQIFPPKNFKSRPTTDVSKESLFNVINNYFDIEEISVLDLFSGTGNISYEFASRNCKQIHLVESLGLHYFFIVKTIKELGFDQIKTFKADAYSFLKRSKATYDIIFADPPYNQKQLKELPDIVFLRKILNKDGWLIIEHSDEYSFEKHANYLETKKYGKVHFTIFTEG